MPLRPVRLLPATGLDLTYADDRSVQQGSTRGMTNFRVVDSELWLREGEIARRRDIFSNAWNHAVSLDLQYGNTTALRHFLISQWGVLEVNLSDWSLSVPYSSEYEADIIIQPGSTTATVYDLSLPATKLLDKCNLMIAPDADGKNTAFFISNVSGVGNNGDTFQIDRPYPGTTAGITNAKFYATFGKPDRQNRRDNHRCSWTVFRQNLTLAEGAVWNAGATSAPWYLQKSPAVTAGGIYLIVSPGVVPAAGVPRGPFAIRLDQTEKIKADFMRKTVTDTAAGVAFDSSSTPSYCETWQNRLFIVREDENNANGDRTIWFSTDGNMLWWHNGTVGINAVHARERFGEGHDPITGLKLLGDSLIVHRARSQNILSKTGSAATPFRSVRNDQGLGFVSSHSIQNVRGAHYGWTEYGPATFDGQRIQLMPKGILRIASLMRSTSEWSVGTNGFPESIASAYHAARQQIWWLIAGSNDYWESQFSGEALSTQVMVLDLQTGAAWRYTYESGFSLGVFRGDREIVVRSRQGGTLVQATQTERAKDDRFELSDPLDQEPPGYIEFPWHDCGSGYRKSIHKIELELRGWSTDSKDGDDAITDVAPTSGSNFNYKLQIHTDHNVSQTPVDIRVQVPTDSYLAATTTTEGTRLAPTVLFVAKPYIHGNTFKLRLANDAQNLQQRRPLRVSQVTLWVQDQESDDAPTRRERVP